MTVGKRGEGFWSGVCELPLLFQQFLIKFFPTFPPLSASTLHYSSTQIHPIPNIDLLFHQLQSVLKYRFPYATLTSWQKDFFFKSFPTNQNSDIGRATASGYGVSTFSLKERTMYYLQSANHILVSK